MSALNQDWPSTEVIQIRDDWETLVRLPSYSIEMYFELEVEQRKADDREKGTFHLVRVLRARRQASKLTLSRKAVEKALRHRTWLTKSHVKFIVDRLPQSVTSMANFNLGANNDEMSQYLWSMYNRHFVTSEYMKLTVDFGLDFRVIQRLGDDEMLDLLERLSDREFLWQLCVASATYHWNEIALDAADVAPSSRRVGQHPHGWMEPMFPVGLRDATFNAKRMKEPLVDTVRGDAPFDDEVITFCSTQMKYSVHTHGHSIIRFKYERNDEESNQKLAQLKTLDTLGVFRILTQDLPVVDAVEQTQQEQEQQQSLSMLHPDHPLRRREAIAAAAAEPAPTTPQYIEAVPCFIERAVNALVSYLDAMHKAGRLLLLETMGPWYYDYVSTKIIEPVISGSANSTPRIQCVCPNDAYASTFQEYTGLREGVISWSKIRSTTVIQQALHKKARVLKQTRFKLFIVDSLHMFSIVDLYNLLVVLFRGSIAKLVLIGDPNHVPLNPGQGHYEKICHDLFRRPHRTTDGEPPTVSTYSSVRVELNEMIDAAENLSVPRTFNIELMEVISRQRRGTQGIPWDNSLLRDAVKSSGGRVQFMSFMEFSRRGFGRTTTSSGDEEEAIVFCASRNHVDDLYALDARRYPDQARPRFMLKAGDWLWMPDVSQNAQIDRLYKRRDDSDNGFWEILPKNAVASCRKDMLVVKLVEPCDSHRRCCGLNVNYRIDTNDKNTMSPDLHPWACRVRFITADQWTMPSLEEKVFIVLDIPKEQQQQQTQQNTMMDFMQFHSIISRAQSQVVIVGDVFVLEELMQQRPERDFRSSYLRYKMMNE